MKLLYFTIQINMLGGLAKIVIEKINWLVDHGYEVTLCNIEKTPVLPAYPINKKVKLVQGNLITESGGALTRLIWALISINKVNKIIKEENPDIVINAHCPIVTWILPFLLLRKVQTGKRVPIVTEIHQSRQGLEVFDKLYLNKFSQWIHRWSPRWIYGKYDRFVVLTNGDKDSWNLPNCVAIPNFSSIGKIDKTEVRIRKEDPHRIILLARIKPQKRIDLMIKAWARIHNRYPNWQVVLYGEGNWRPFYQEGIDILKLNDSFFMPGELRSVEKELESADILCLTSEYEGFGIVLIEAQRKGVPVIAFEYVGVHDIIENEVDGLIVPFGDINAYSESLSSLIESEELRLRLATNALESVTKFDKEYVMGMWNRLFNEL